MANELPAPLFQIRIRNRRLWLALRLKLSRSKMKQQEFGEKYVVPLIERQCALELDELSMIPDIDN